MTQKKLVWIVKDEANVRDNRFYGRGHLSCPSFPEDTGPAKAQARGVLNKLLKEQGQTGLMLGFELLDDLVDRSQRLHVAQTIALRLDISGLEQRDSEALGAWLDLDPDDVPCGSIIWEGIDLSRRITCVTLTIETNHAD